MHEPFALWPLFVPIKYYQTQSKSLPQFNSRSIKATDFDHTDWQSRIWINKRQCMGNWHSHLHGQLEAPTVGQQKAPNVACEYLSLSLTNVWWSISISISNHFHFHFHFQPFPTIPKFIPKFIQSIQPIPRHLTFHPQANECYKNIKITIHLS